LPSSELVTDTDTDSDSEEVEEVDLLVVGGGKAGKSLAMDRARAGRRVLMVERDKIGGTCINVACIPTKALVESARTLRLTRRAAEMGVAVEGEPTVALDLLRRHKETVVAGMVDAHRDMFAESGMDFVLGTARFLAERTVAIDVADGSRRFVSGVDVVINTGTSPAVPDIAGLDAAEAWTSETILQLERIPESLLIIGGGYIGCEFASMFATFGTAVTIVHGGAQLLPREDPDVAETVAGALRSQGVEVRLGSRAASVDRPIPGGRIIVAMADGSAVEGSDLLVATGRAPVTAELGLDSAGVEVTEAGFVEVDDHLRTTAPHTWAAGDVTGGMQFTHLSWHDFRVIRENLSGGDAATTDRLVPYTVFTTPELARVGLTETEARARGHRVRVATLATAAIPRAKTARDTVGTWKAVVDGDTDLILGAALFGRDSGEVVTALQMAMLGGLRYQQVRDAVITHPTMGEGLNLLFDALGGDDG